MMTDNRPLRQQHFFKDQAGHIAIWQWPNVPLWGWIICKGLTLLITQKHLKSGFDGLSTGFIFTWAFLELTQGVNYFRRLAGLTVLGMTVAGFFM